MVAPPCGMSHGRGFFVPAASATTARISKAHDTMPGPFTAVTAAAARVSSGVSTRPDFLDTQHVVA
jgi:hypothetical protein